jgi:hypothetical protein
MFAIACSNSMYVLSVSATPNETPAIPAACKMGFLSRFIMPCTGAVTKSKAFSVTFHAFPARLAPKPRTLLMP